MPHCFLTSARTRPLVGALLVAVAGATAAPAWADAYGDVQRLAGDGQTAAALQSADAYIAQHPGDPQMRFIKANVLDRLGRAPEAEVILKGLTQDYPELAEPWNNLAVIYASQGKLDQAREALDTALRIRPNYATALENLGDVRLREALQAYERAQAADKAAQLAPRIDAIRALVPDTTSGR